MTCAILRTWHHICEPHAQFEHKNSQISTNLENDIPSVFLDSGSVGQQQFNSSVINLISCLKGKTLKQFDKFHSLYLLSPLFFNYMVQLSTHKLSTFQAE